MNKLKQIITQALIEDPPAFFGGNPRILEPFIFT